MHVGSPEEQHLARWRQAEEDLAQARAALRQSEARLAEVQAVAHLGSWDWDVRTGHLIWSEEMCRIFGVSPETFTPSYEGFIAMLPEEDAAGVQAVVARAREEGTPFEHLHAVRRPDGEVRFLHARGQVVMDAQGVPLRMIGTAHDVTEARRAEQALAEAAERLERERWQRERIEKLEELDRLKSDFLNAASHELRTPLTSIIGYGEFLEDEVAGPLTAQQREFLARIREGSQRLSQIVDDLLDFARLEAGTFQLVSRPTDLAEVVRREAALLLPQTQRAGVAFAVELPPGPLTLSLDPTRVGQVIANLMSNAIKFTPEGGRVALRLTPLAEGAQLAIADTGIGIPAEDLGRIFEKFYQVDRSTTRRHGGAGLGLAITKALVEAMGGAIGVESTPGVGTTFRVTLPGAPQGSRP